MFGKILGSLMLAACCGFAAIAVNAAPVRIVKQVRENPTLRFDGVAGDPVLSEAMESILRACGWFDLTKNNDAVYQLKGMRSGSGVTLSLSIGGAETGRWTIGGGNPRTVAKRAVDAVIEKSFKELKVNGFCNSRIAFCAETSRGVRNIFACDIDGNDIRQITNFRSMCVEPCWFPDGRSIGYSKYNRSGMDVLQTTLAPVRTRRLTGFRGINAGAAISPDGRNLAVILSIDHKVDLYVMPLPNGKLRRLTNSISVEASPCWSPDGREIAFVSDESGQPRIYVVSANGGARRRLPSIGIDAVTPDWSQDGGIVYATRVDGAYTVAVYNMATGENKRVVEEGGAWESPAWAADGRQVVCKRTGAAKSALYVIDTWTGRTRLLVATPHNLSMPVWSPCFR
ncbi:MAG: hypothetical protein PHI35_00560 [Victivallaceae bacterium]|nr:hypothetical protein [Victivallaceae bacterium]